MWLTFSSQSQYQNMSLTPYVIGKDETLTIASDFLWNANFGQSTFYTASNTIYAFPGGSVNPVIYWKESSLSNLPFGLVMNPSKLIKRTDICLPYYL